MGNELAAEHGFHGEVGLIAQFGHVGRWLLALNALVGVAVDQAAVENAVPPTLLHPLLFQVVSRKEVMVIDAAAGEQGYSLERILGTVCAIERYPASISGEQYRGMDEMAGVPKVYTQE